jgi:hypothetical protein
MDEHEYPASNQRAEDRDGARPTVLEIDGNSVAATDTTVMQSPGKPPGCLEELSECGGASIDHKGGLIPRRIHASVLN